MTHTVREAGHRAACTLCRDRSVEEVVALRDQVTADLASGTLVPMTADEVIAAISTRPSGGSQGSGGTEQKAQESRNP